ncbi:citrate transporter [[Clostridium] symbiosum]|uniref:citrate transporter n=1 Tax=Clostridium symbiosum TaxID=1512 RepID=UPI001D064E58|nr:citrate transporter [[Clostridium] symbiosum]MCB6611248.1 citrate transporter [[Clostridium] symbiosum]MCB6929426.1 citrate transporter [[Clostridium] symbiosum]
MPDSIVILTPLHILYLVGVFSVLAVMVMRRDTPLICVLFLFLLGALGLHSFIGGIQTVFNAILYAAKEFMEVIGTIALVTALSKCMGELGSDRLLMEPMSKVMKTPSRTWWLLGITMFVFSLFLWPSPSVALVGAIMIPFAVRAGLSPLAAAMAMNLFGHGFALSYDVVIQGAPAISGAAAGISAADILSEAWPVFWVMGGVTVLSAFLLNRKSMGITVCSSDRRFHVPYFKQEADEKETPVIPNPKAAKILAAAVVLAFLADIVCMLVFNLNGGDATSVVSGTAVLLMCLGAVIGFGKHSPEKVTGYLTDGFLFAIRIFAPVIVIGAFFFLGGGGITTILGDGFGSGILNDWALWLASHTPLNPYIAAFFQLLIGGLTGLDGSGFSGLPLTGALAHTFGTATSASVPVLAALGQIGAIFVGGGTIVPWGLIPVAAICNVNPIELARKNLIPVLIGFTAAFAAACLMLV